MDELQTRKQFLQLPAKMNMISWLPGGDQNIDIGSVLFGGLTIMVTLNYVFVYNGTY